MLYSMKAFKCHDGIYMIDNLIHMTVFHLSPFQLFFGSIYNVIINTRISAMFRLDTCQIVNNTLILCYDFI